MLNWTVHFHPKLSDSPRPSTLDRTHQDCLTLNRIRSYQTFALERFDLFSWFSMANSSYHLSLFGLNDIENKNVPWLLSLSILKSGFFNSAIFNGQTVFNTVPMHFKWLSTYNEPFVSKMPKMSAIKKRLSSILRLTYFSWSKGHYGKCQKWHFKV